MYSIQEYHSWTKEYAVHWINLQKDKKKDHLSKEHKK